MILTKSGGILGPIASVLGIIMDFLFQITSQFGVFNVGLCIILFTIVTKMLMLPLTIKQQKSTKLMSVMNPEIQAIQAKYKGKTDNESMQRQNVELQAVYDKYGTSMTGGCLPLLIQMPILFALFSVVRNIPAYVASVRVSFDNVVNAVMAQGGYVEKITTITDITKALNNVAVEKYDFTSADKLVDMLYNFSATQWAELEAAFPAISTTIAENAEAIADMNYFFGLNVAEAPGWMPSLAWIIPILAGLSQFISVKILQGKQQQKADPDNAAAQSMQTMNNTMPLMSAFFCITMPIGLGIYWIASSVVQIIQQLAINAYMEKIDIDEMVKKNIEKVNKKRAKQGLPPTKVSSVSTTLEEARAAQEKEKQAEEAKKERIAKQIEASKKIYNNDPNPDSLASKAAMVQKYNEAHEKRSNKNK
ncbi:MAG: membrane protein insertase YidC [Lachnospiraceae bacterium]|nr:membrane protein insertase YidC [Lachnospiraceae bacterium]